MEGKRLLKWEHYDEDQWTAETKIQDYHVQQQDYRDGTTKYEASYGNEWPCDLGAFDTPEHAIDACEQDYIARCTELLTAYTPATHVVLSRDRLARHIETLDSLPVTPYYRVVVTNPPFSQSLEFVEACLRRAPIVVMLLRLNWLASQKRNPFLREHTPSVYILPRRPSFTGTGTDATDYAWFVWGMGAPTVNVIDLEVCR
jgi:hypothetical protein